MEAHRDVRRVIGPVEGRAAPCPLTLGGQVRRHSSGVRAPVWGVAGACLIASMGAQSARSPSIPALLDSYSRGDFSGAVRAAASWPDLVSWRKSFPPAARAWIDSVPDQRDRRRLVAAGLVLEVVRERYERDSAVWLPLRDVLEWACGELRQTSVRSPGEQAWHRASVALGTRARDWPWLTDGSTRFTSPGPGKKANDHARHGRQRFPSDPRFALSVVVARTSHFDTDILTRAV